MPKCQVHVNFAAVPTAMRFMGQRVFIESTGDEVKDRRMQERFQLLWEGIMVSRNQVIQLDLPQERERFHELSR